MAQKIPAALIYRRRGSAGVDWSLPEESGGIDHAISWKGM
jgi:hypothetical protein